jgi:hypothetical protein
MRAYSNDFFSVWIYVYPIFFGTLWCVVCYLISVLSGWHALVRRFCAHTEAYGDAKSAGPFFYGVQMRFSSNYSSVIRLTAASDALFISILFPFRVGHPPLSIPWNEITFSKTIVLWRRYLVLTLGREEQIPMRISERMARELGVLERGSPC